MKAFGRFLLIVLLLGNLSYMAALSVHVVRTPGKFSFSVVPKGQTSLLDTYVDTREWSVADRSSHTVVVDDIIRAGKGEILMHIGVPAATTVTPHPVPFGTPSSDSKSDAPRKTIFDSN